MAHTASLGLRAELADLWATPWVSRGPRGSNPRVGS